jgi:AraC family transcriptional regulator
MCILRILRLGPNAMKPNIRPSRYTVFNHLRGEGVPLRVSAALSEGVGAALWERNETTSTSYVEPGHHTLSLYVDGGTGIRRRRGRTAIGSLGAGSLCLMPAGLTTNWDVDGPVRLFHLYIPRRALDRIVVEALGADPALVSLRDESYFRDPQIEALIRRAILPRDWHAPADRLAISEAAEQILARLATHFTDRDGRAMVARGGLAPAIQRRVSDFIDANLDGPIALNDLAGEAGLSTFHFARMFKRTMGESPQDYVLRRRIARAQALIANGDQSLATIAQSCGFSGQSHFTARFRAALGITPGQFQQAISSGVGRAGVA